MARFTTLCALPLALVLSLVSAQGLGIEVTKPADCTRKTQEGDKITVNYKGTLESDGSQFDSSYDRGDPFKFTLGAGQVIAGWDQGLVGMCIGEGRKLTIPPSLGYGSFANGPIPASSTLIFETELLGIDGVQADPEKPSPATSEHPSVASSTEPTEPSGKPIPTAVATPASSEQRPAASDAPAEPAASTSDKASPMESDDNGECHLLGPYALIVQGALGLLAVSSLAYKRWRETPRRPLKIWFFDVSKQVFGSVLLHLANILMSMLSSGKFDVAANTKATPQYAGQDDKGDLPNPCSFYLLNLAIDTTIGIPILVLLLKVLHRAFLLTPMANPPESIRSGNYGHPPRANWWLKQSVIYFLGLLGMKLCVFFIFQLLPWIAWVGDWALRWTEGSETLQILFVMFIFPLIMNAMQYWIIDGFIKDPAANETNYEAAAGEESDDESDDEWLERRRQRGVDEDSDVEDSEPGPLKEANPTTIPVRSREYDPHIEAGSSRDRRKERSE